MRKHNLPAWVVLTLISLVAALLLGATYEMTKGPIANQEIEKASAMQRELLPDAASFEDMTADSGLSSLYKGLDADGNTVGYVATTLASGYGGEIEIVIGLDGEGTLKGIRVGGSNFSETPGLGARAKDAAFTDQFEGLTTPITLNEDVDAITSATITSNAVVRGVNSAVSEVAKIAGFGGGSNLETGIGENGGFYGVAEGFHGPVYVEILLDEQGAISEIVIGDENFNETPGYGMKAQEPAFAEQFIGLSGEIALGEQVDAIAGATITSEAVESAVNAAFEAANSGVAIGKTEDGRYYAVSDGFAGDVYVEITVDENGQIATIVIGDENFKESAGYGQKAKEPAFYEQFVGLTGELTLNEDVDAIAGATITSKAVLQSVNRALALANGQRIVLTEAGESIDADTTASATVASAPAADADTTASATGTVEETATDADTTASATGTVEETTTDADTTASATGTVEETTTDADTTASATGTVEETTTDADTTASATGSAEATEAPAADADTTASATGTVEETTTDADTTASATGTTEEPEVTEAPAADADTTASATGTTEEPEVTEAPAADADTTASATGTTEEPEATEAPAADADTTASATGAATGDAEIETGITEDGHYYARVKGFVGMVYVEITLDENGVITDIIIGDADFKESDGYGKKAQEPAFYEQFIGKSGVIALHEDVDAITGATITSEAVVKAVNAALELAK